MTILLLTPWSWAGPFWPAQRVWDGIATIPSHRNHGQRQVWLAGPPPQHWGCSSQKDQCPSETTPYATAFRFLWWIIHKEITWVVNKSWGHPVLFIWPPGLPMSRGHFKESSYYSSLLMLSWQPAQGSGSCQIGIKNIFAFLFHFWTQARDSETAWPGQHHLSDRYN